jgi:hypothetical protein
LAWWNRVPGVNRIVSGINRINDRLAGTGGTQPQRMNVPDRYDLQPTPEGYWRESVTQDFLPPRDVEPEDDYWYGEDIPEPEVDMYGQYLEPLPSMSVEEWQQEALRPKEYLLERYGIDNLDIMHRLDSMGYIDDKDWEDWRDWYGSMYGG